MLKSQCNGSLLCGFITLANKFWLKCLLKASCPSCGCGSNGKVVASNTRGTQSLAKIIMKISTVNCRKDENKEKRGQECFIFKRLLISKITFSKNSN